VLRSTGGQVHPGREAAAPVGRRRPVLLRARPSESSAPTSQAGTRQEVRRAAVYRLYDADGLLYIGSAYDPDHRCKSHLGKPCWPLVVRRTEEWHPTRGHAYSAEMQTIVTEGSKHNIMGAPEHQENCRRRAREDPAHRARIMAGSAAANGAPREIVQAILRGEVKSYRRRSTSSSRVHDSAPAVGRPGGGVAVRATGSPPLCPRVGRSKSKPGTGTCPAYFQCASGYGRGICPGRTVRLARPRSDAPAVGRAAGALCRPCSACVPRSSRAQRSGPRRWRWRGPRRFRTISFR
jgi:hypothetical protein